MSCEVHTEEVLEEFGLNWNDFGNVKVMARYEAERNYGTAAEPIELVSAPNEVENLVMTTLYNDVTLTWDAPLSDNGSPVVDYSICLLYDVDDYDDCYDIIVGITATTYTITALTGGITYDFEVWANSAIGEGYETWPDEYNYICG